VGRWPAVVAEQAEELLKIGDDTDMRAWAVCDCERGR
jgi:hypothetical protein